MAEFADFYATYYGRLRACAIAVFGYSDADDLAQEAMVRAYASYDRLDPERDPWPWLTQILRNVARDRYARRPAVPLTTVPGETADTTDDADERVVVRAALRRLSPSDRDVLVLRECHELSFGELATLTGRSQNTLRQQVFRARRRLAEAYTAIGGRAVALACWARRWHPDAATATAATTAAAVAVAAALVAGGPAGPGLAGEGTTAGPVGRVPAPAGPAAGRAAPAPPLQRARATRPEAPPSATAPVVRPAAPTASPTVVREAEVTAGPVGHEHEVTRDDDPAITCTVLGLCYPSGAG